MGSIATWLLAAYLALLALLALFGVHRLRLLALRRLPAPPLRPAGDPAAAGSPLPRVTVQLPLFNERCVAARLIDAACALDWPPDRLEVQVLDDSTDGCRDLAAARVAFHRARGFPIVHLPRASRRGFKAGALAEGLRSAGGDLIAVFDADFVPPPDFLRRMVPPFADPGIGMVQARWGHLNAAASSLTRLQATLLDGHFRIDHPARARGGLFFNFNGTAGVWRRACLEQAGGWQADTLTEDLDLSYRAQLAGWRFVYLEDVVVPAEIPEEIAAFKSQQHRWAKGSIQTARKLLPVILSSPIPRRQKVEALFHLADNGAYLLLLLLSVLLLASLPARRAFGWALVGVETPLFLLGTGSVAAFYLRSQALSGVPPAARWRRLPGILSLGIGLTVNNGRAVLEGLLGGGGEFRRTPKRGAESPGAAYRAPADPLALAECLLAAGFVAAGAWALRTGTYSALPFLALYAAGFSRVGLAQAAALRGRRLAPRAPRRAAGVSPT